MKVLHINKSDLTGGAAVAAKRLIKALRRHGVEAQLLVDEKKSDHTFAIKARKGPLGKLLSFLRFILERLYFLPHEREKSVRFSFSPAVTGMNIANKPLLQKYDLLHLHWFNQGYISISGLRKIFRKPHPIVWTMHDMWSFTGGCHYTHACTHYKQACGKCPLLKHPDENDLSHRVHQQKKFLKEKENIVFVACSEWLADKARASSLLQGKKIVAIPNAIKISHFRPLSRAPFRRELRIDTNNPVILFGAANINDTRKGFYFLQKAIEKLIAEGKLKDFTLLLFGKASIDTLLNIKFKYKHIPYADYKLIVKLYNAADVTVLPSLQDNLPNTVMESLACGTPVVAFHTGGIPEMIQHEQTGYLATPGSVNELSDGLLWALNHPEPEQLRKDARTFVEENYSEEVVAQRYKEVYKSLLA